MGKVAHKASVLWANEDKVAFAVWVTSPPPPIKFTILHPAAPSAKLFAAKTKLFMRNRAQ